MYRNPAITKLVDAINVLAGGITQEEAKNGLICVFCRKAAVNFRDAVSRREYAITRTCQECQDELFASPPRVDK